MKCFFATIIGLLKEKLRRTIIRENEEALMGVIKEALMIYFLENIMKHSWIMQKNEGVPQE